MALGVSRLDLEAAFGPHGWFLEEIRAVSGFWWHFRVKNEHRNLAAQAPLQRESSATGTCRLLLHPCPLLQGSARCGRPGSPGQRVSNMLALLTAGRDL
jgi:hypothetical protein